MIIAIDGPAGAGKSTVAQELAKTLGYQLVDTGAMYRTVAFEALNAGVDLGDEEAVAKIARTLSFEFRFVEGENVVFCNGKALDQEIRTAEVSRAASIISAHPDVRTAMVEQQQRVGRGRSSVLEGRDIGTVVFPDAEVKAFVTASAETRARRRLEQMEECGEDGDYQEVLKEIVARDKRDTEREVAPLKQAEDAVVVDTTEMTIEEVLRVLRARVEAVRSPRGE